MKHPVLHMIAWITVMVSSVIGAVVGYGIYDKGRSVMDQILGVCVPLAFAVVPYCIARALTGIDRIDATVAKARKDVR